MRRPLTSLNSDCYEKALLPKAQQKNCVVALRQPTEGKRGEGSVEIIYYN